MKRATATFLTCIAISTVLMASDRASGFIPDVPNLNPTRRDPGFNTPAGSRPVFSLDGRPGAGRVKVNEFVSAPAISTQPK